MGFFMKLCWETTSYRCFIFVQIKFDDMEPLAVLRGKSKSKRKATCTAESLCLFCEQRTREGEKRVRDVLLERKQTQNKKSF